MAEAPAAILSKASLPEATPPTPKMGTLPPVRRYMSDMAVVVGQVRSLITYSIRSTFYNQGIL